MVEGFANEEGLVEAQELETASERVSNGERKSAWADYETVFTNAKAGERKERFLQL